MAVLNNPAGYLVSAVQAQRTGSALDCRHCGGGAYLWYQASGQSAVFNIEVSHDLTAWMVLDTLTATATQTGTAQYIGVLPYVRANITKAYTGTGGATSGTAMLWAHWSPGLVG